jgi:hypothetical protein
MLLQLWLPHRLLLFVMTQGRRFRSGVRNSQTRYETAVERALHRDKNYGVMRE